MSRFLVLYQYLLFLLCQVRVTNFSSITLGLAKFIFTSDDCVQRLGVLANRIGME